MALERRTVEKGLKKKGFEPEEDRDHRVYFFRHDGLNQAVFTKVSTGTSYKTLGDELVSKMARQVRLSTHDFARLVKCPLSKKGYEAILREKRLLPPLPKKAQPTPKTSTLGHDDEAQEQTDDHT